MIDPIARMLLTGEIKDGQKVEGDAGDDSVLVFRGIKTPKPAKDKEA